MYLVSFAFAISFTMAHTADAQAEDSRGEMAANKVTVMRMRANFGILNWGLLRAKKLGWMLD
jgi:hypothetical protein